MTDSLDRLKTALEGRYRIERELGAGGMATVYVAEDLRHNRQVALKVVRPELAASLGGERFLREIEIAARLSHPHVLPLYDSGGSGDALFYVMPLVEGHSLRDRLKGGGLPLDEGTRIIREVADALAYSHAHGVVHRDVKPENVLISSSHALVTDFGVAKAVREARDTVGLTGTGVSLGTPAYMAPEQASADPAADHRVDIYALGVMAYEVLAGQPPFVGNTQQVLTGHLTRRPEPLSSYRSTVPAPLEAIVMRCLEKNPADRPQSADEIMRAIDGLPATSQVIAAPAASSSRPSVRDRKWSRLVGAAVVVVTLAVVGVTWFARVGRAGTLIGDAVLAENDVVLVSEFENHTPDSSLAATITDAIRTELQQSRAVRVMSQSAMWAGLSRMGLEHGAALPQAKLQELAEREGAKAFIVGDIARLGSGYQLTARVVATAGGAEPLTVKATANGENDLIAAVEKVGRDLRRGIGESLRSVFAAPALAQVTTASLPALRAYTAGSRLNNDGKLVEAVTLGQQAIALDSGFAAAYTLLYSAYTNSNQVTKATDAIREAYRLRERLPEVERLRIEARYHGTRGDMVAEEAAWRRLVELGRDESNYAAMLAAYGRLEEAEVMARRGVKSTPKSGVAYWNLAELQVALHEFEAADSTLALLKEQLPGNNFESIITVTNLSGRRDYDAIEAFLASGEAAKLTMADMMRCFANLQRGRVKAWQACPSQDPLVYRNALAQVAEFRMTGDTSRAKVGYESFLKSPPDERDPDRYAFTILLLADVGKVREASNLLDEWRNRKGVTDPEYRADSALAVGAIAAAQKQWDRAVAAFLAWNQSPPATAMTLYNRGLPEAAAILAREGKSDSAIVLFERAHATSSSYGGFLYEPGWYAQSLEMLGDLYEARGDREKAAEKYRRYIAIYKDPDPVIAKQVDVVREKLKRVTGERTKG